MESEDDRRPLPPTLVPSLNELLVSLSLPFTLEIPTDLTPSLLLAILESIIEARLPIPNSVRASRTREAKIRAMLVLLGVLECDVLRGGIDGSEVLDGEDPGGVNVSVEGWTADIGLGEVDPEKLADGGWEETVFVGELLCWLARRRGILPPLSASHGISFSQSYVDDDPSEDFTTSLLLQPSPTCPVADISTMSHITDVPRHPRVHSPEPSTAGTTTTDLSMREKSVSSQTSISGSHALNNASTVSDDTTRPYSHEDERNEDPPPVFRPRCIHELDDPSFIRALAGPSTPSRSLQRSSARQTPRADDYFDARDADLGSEAGDSLEPPTPTPRRVRLTGWIDEVDTRAELKQFVASRVHSGSLSLEPRLTSRVESTFESGKASSSVNPCMATPSLTTTIVSRTAVPMRPGATVRPPDDHDDDPDDDPHFNVSFSALLNTSTPVKPKSRARAKQPLQIFRQPSPLHTHSEYSASSQVPSQVPSERRLPLVPSQESQAHMMRRREVDVDSAHTSHLPTSRSSHRSSNLRNSLASSAGTATTVSLLNERARLLTELVAVKRARADSRGGTVDR